MQPKVHYAKIGEEHVAYQVLGDGPIDLVLVPTAVTHLECSWEDPSFAQYLRHLASFARVIRFDKRGTGLSDRFAGVRPLEERMDDVRAVMDAVGSERAALVGESEGGAMSILFAATHPDRTSALVVYGATANAAVPGIAGSSAVDIPSVIRRLQRNWGQKATMDFYAPSRVGDAPFEAWWLRNERLGVSPGAVASIFQMVLEIDIRHVLTSVRVPTLVLHRAKDRLVPIENGRYIAEHIPGAKFVELSGEDHPAFLGDADLLVGEIEEFLTGQRHAAECDRILATVLFTDIVGSTERAAALGDVRWRDLLNRHHSRVRQEVGRFRGREVDTAGDGFFATFDGPARAIRCACAIRDAVKELGITIRAGLHTGECEVMDDKLGGIAVHLGARVAQAAKPDEVLVSTTVKDLVAGSGLRFTDRGTHALHGISGEWQLFSAEL
jgi:class 3 adenylate cyclase